MSRKRDYSESDEMPPSSPVINHSAPSPGSSPGIPFSEDDADLVDQEDMIDDLDEQAEEEAGEDLFNENMLEDYKGLEDQRGYDLGARDIDDENEFEAMDPAARRRVEMQLNRRDQRLQGNRRGAYLDGDDDDNDVDMLTQPSIRRRRNQYDEDVEYEDPMNKAMSAEALADVKAASVAEWITVAQVSKTIRDEFMRFLKETVNDKGESVYGTKLKEQGSSNSESLEIEYNDLVNQKATLAYFLTVAPAEMFPLLDQVALEAMLIPYPDYISIHSELHVRISGLPVQLTLRELREEHMNTLVRVTGVVTRRTGVFPQLKYVKFDCPKCGELLGPYLQDSNQEVRISYCHSCQSRGPFLLNSENTVYRNYQKITLQESPGTVPAGRLPRHREVILLADLVDTAKPGEEVDVTGIYKNAYDGALNAKNGFPVFSTVIEANLIRRKGDASKDLGREFTEDEQREIRQLSRSKFIIDKIINSIAPSIYGHRDIKTAIACSLFGGVAKDINGKHSIRGDINVLLLGDPGTAKSQLLKYAEKTAHRAVFATGQGASAVGLTASVRKDPVTREWTLEGGALVLADQGTCLIDEFDKMNDQDRTSIHEAMEQQSISISKAGIVTSLQARCAIIAAANPTGGRYNSTVPFSQNVELTEPILSRFDVLCVVRDLVRPEDDERLASFVVDSHSRSHPLLGERVRPDSQNDEDVQFDRLETDVINHEAGLVNSYNSNNNNNAPHEAEGIPQELLRKYIHYARTKCHPKLHHVDMDKISKVYADMRRESLATGSFPITVRHLESILRLSESFAKMRLSEFVSKYDIDRAIRVAVESFVGAQKVSVKKSLERGFRKYTL